MSHVSRQLPRASRAGQSRLGTLVLVVALFALSFAGGALTQAFAHGQLSAAAGPGATTSPTNSEACTGEVHKLSASKMRLMCEIANQDVCTNSDGKDGDCRPSTSLPTALPGQLGSSTIKYCSCEGQAQGDCCQVVIKQVNGMTVGPVAQGSCLQALGCSSQSSSLCLLSFSKQNDPPFNEIWKATCLGKL